jgi:hypothetical protein
MRHLHGSELAKVRSDADLLLELLERVSPGHEALPRLREALAGPSLNDTGRNVYEREGKSVAQIKAEMEEAASALQSETYE